jgi:hypothetical protein
MLMFGCGAEPDAENASQSEQTSLRQGCPLSGPDLCGTDHTVELSATIAASQASSQHARKLEARDAHRFCEPIEVQVPNSIETVGAPFGSALATLVLERVDHGRPSEVRCAYTRERKSVVPKLELRSCTGAYKAGKVITAQGFQLVLEADHPAAIARTARVALTDGRPRQPGQTRQIFGSGPELTGVMLEADATSLPPYSGLALRVGMPLSRLQYVDAAPPGNLVVGPSVEVVATTDLPPDAVHLTLPVDTALVASLPAGSADTLRVVQIDSVTANYGLFDQHDLSNVKPGSESGTLRVGLGAPGFYYPAVRDLTPLTHHGGPVMDQGVTIYPIWAGDFGKDPAFDSRSAVRTFINGLGTTPWYRILSTYGIQNFDIKVAAEEKSYPEITSLVNNSKTGVRDLVKRAIDDGLPKDNNGIYIVFGASGLAENSSSGTFCNDYCGWHGVDGLSDPHVKLAFVGNNGTCGFATTGSPHGWSNDFTVSCTAHEIVEAITDPEISAWHGVDQPGGYASYVELADKCATLYPARTWGTDGWSNLSVNGDRFYVQGIWVNQDGGYCGIGVERLSLAVVAQPDSLAINQIGHFKVRVTNVGAAPLGSGSVSILGRASGLLSGIPTPQTIGSQLAPDQSVEIDVPVQAPYEIEGNSANVAVTFTAMEVANNGHVFPDSALTSVEVRRADLLLDKAECASVEASPSVAVAGDPITVTATFRNKGSTLWLPGSYKLVALPVDVAHPFQVPGLSNVVRAGDEFTATFTVDTSDMSAGTDIPISVAMANPASAFLDACTTSAQIQCAPTKDQPCGCNGTTLCDGSCSVVIPANCPPGWTAPADDPEACEYHSTTGVYLWDKDYGDNQPMATLSQGAPRVDAQLHYSYLRIDYMSGGCWDGDTPDAISASCETFSGNLTQRDTGNPTYKTGRIFENVGSSCALGKLRGWTPLGQGTCAKFANLDTFWRIRRVCG